MQSESIADLLADIKEKSDADMCIYCNDNTAKDHGDRRYVDHIREHLAPPDDEFLKDVSDFLRRNPYFNRRSCVYCNDPTNKDYGNRRYMDHVREHLAPINDRFAPRKREPQ